MKTITRIVDQLVWLWYCIKLKFNAVGRCELCQEFLPYQPAWLKMKAEDEVVVYVVCDACHSALCQISELDAQRVK